MTTPIGLTRAEEAAEQPAQPRTAAAAAPGVPTCRVALPNGDDCPAAATHRIVWASRDGQDEPTRACVDCAERMQQIAASHRTIIRVELLE